MVNTFLPYADFKQSAACLDRHRLNSQRSEAFLIIQTLTEERKSWRNHPAVKMWRGHVEYLKMYHRTIVHEWKRRGYVHNGMIWEDDGLILAPPSWLGDERVHSSHRQTLLFKKPEWYSQFGWSEKPCYGYFWPT